MTARRSINTVPRELAIVLARVHHSLRIWMMYARRMENSLRTVSEERDELLAERDRHNRAMRKARSAIHSAVTRRAFDEVYRRAMGAK